MKKNKWIAIVFVAVVVVGVVCAVSADVEQDYNDKCSSCHGTEGLGYYEIDGSVCSLESIDEIVDCYSGIGAHGSVSDCDETCVEETNAYIYDVLLLAIAESQYADLCASCHGDDGVGYYDLDASVCDMDSIDEMVDCYSGIGAHGGVADCDGTCVWNTNRYIYEVIGVVDAEDKYNGKCAGCHGEDGLGYYYLEGSVCSLESVDEIVECYQGIGAHDSVNGCGETCIEETNTYFYEELLPEIDAGLYSNLCTSCHGEGGLGSYEIDGSICSLESVDEMVDCYSEIGAHDDITTCGEACIERTNTYIYDVLLLEIGEGLYTDLCAGCHGDDGMTGAALDGSVCDMETFEAMVECYPSIGAHGGVSGCDDTCVLLANRYAFDAFLDNAVADPPDDTDDDDDAASTDESNDNWVTCFIDICLSGFHF